MWMQFLEYIYCNTTENTRLTYMAVHRGNLSLKKNKINKKPTKGDNREKILSSNKSQTCIFRTGEVDTEGSLGISGEPHYTKQ